MPLRERFLAAIFLSAFLGGIMRSVAARPHIHEGLWRTDDYEYFEMGRLIQEEGYLGDPHRSWRPTAMRMPLYPAFLALTQKFSGTPAGARRAQILLGVLAVLLAGAIGWRLHSPAAGALAAFLLAMDPRHIEITHWLFIESFFGFTLLVLAWALGRWRLEEKPEWGAAAALAAGLTLACRSTLFALPAAAAAWFWPAKKRAALLILSAYVLLIPWTVRNAFHFKEFQPFERLTSTTVLAAAADGLVEAPDFRELEDAEAARKRGEAWEKIKAKPALYLMGFIQRIPTAGLWLTRELGFIGLPLLLYGAGASAGMEALALLAGVFFASNLLVGLVPRFLFPLQPVALVLVAAGILRALKKTAKAEEPPPSLILVEKVSAGLLILLYAWTLFFMVREMRMFDPGQGLLPVRDTATAMARVGLRLKRHPESQLYVQRAELLSQRGDSLGAAMDLERAVALAPENIDARVRHARALRLSGRKKDALQVLNAAKDYAANHPVSANEFVWQDWDRERNELATMANDAEAIP